MTMEGIMAESITVAVQDKDDDEKETLVEVKNDGLFVHFKKEGNSIGMIDIETFIMVAERVQELWGEKGKDEQVV